MAPQSVDRESTAIRAGKRGGQEAYRRFRTNVAVETKGEPDSVIGPSDAVTEADRAAQRTVVEKIREAHPDDPVVGEESDTLKTLPEKGIVWLIDPIDGTYNYIRGLKHWATSVAVVEDASPKIAVNSIPAMDDVYVATQDVVERNGTPITVSDRRRPEAATIAPVVIPPFGERASYAGGIGQIVEKFGNNRRFGSAQVTLSLVASGAIEGTIATINPHPWDTVAGAYLVEMAGGTVTDIHGDPWSHDSQGIVASNGHVHEKLVDAGATMLENENDNS
jgi:myo-inositol-1(or 4)-monophosphatase